MIPPPPKLSANEINAMYIQMRNQGLNAVWELGRPAMSLTEWRDRELKKLESEDAAT